jgi:hypothetical protein
MAICPFAVQQIIPESYTQGRITPTTLIYHRAVSSAESLQNYWNTPGVELESHFYIGQFGTLYQFMDTGIRADANVDANGFAISVETWDGGNTPDDMPWNPAQLATAKRLAAWVCETHGVIRAAAKTWNGGGIGGHNWFPYPWADGPRGCPGTARNAQIRNDIIPYVANGGGWRDAHQEAPDMDATERAWLKESTLRLRSIHTNGFNDVGEQPKSMQGDLGWFQRQMTIALAPIVARIDQGFSELSDDEAKLLAAIRAQPTGGQVDVPTLAAQLREGLGDELAEALGRRLTNDPDPST